MAKHSDKHKLFTRRAVVFGGLQLLGLSALASRLYYLQFVKNAEYRTLSENNRIKLQLLAPDRGLILDRNGLAMAENEKNYLLFMDAGSLARKEAFATMDKISKIIPMVDKRAQAAIEELHANPYASPLLVREHLTWEEVSAISLHQLDLPGVYIDVGQLRYYPLVERSAHLLGYVGAVAQEEIDEEGDEPLLRLPEYKIGKSGCERMLEDRLRGTPGVKELEVNAHGQSVRELSTKASVAGESVKLTVDRRLQDYGAKLLEGESASAAVIDVENGDVLCLLSTPAFDPNVFSKGIPTDYWQQLHDNKRDPLLNKCVQGMYPPGSTFKPMTGLAGLTLGSIHADTHVFCPGYFMLGDHQFKCWKEGGHGTVNIISALTMSCDTYFYTVAERTGIEKIAEVARAFGLGDVTGLGIPSEKEGIIPDAEWKQNRYKQRWTTGDTVNCGIGQGYVLATPVQLAVLAARIASGKAVVPRLVADDSAVAFDAVDIPDDYLKLVHEGMDGVTNSGSGTAYGHRITDPKYTMAGKTGTSQVRHLEKRGINQATLPWEWRHHGLFIGYAPVAKPKYACAVVVEHGGGGAAAAAPRARDLLWKIQLLADGKEEDPPTVPAKPLP